MYFFGWNLISIDARVSSILLLLLVVGVGYQLDWYSNYDIQAKVLQMNLVET